MAHVRYEEYKEFLDAKEQDCILACNLWLEELGFTTRVDRNHIWSYGIDIDTIEIEMIEQDLDSAEAWDSFLYDHLKCPIVFGSFITSFLHELGHAQTVCFFTDEDIEFSRSILSTMEYFESPLEIAATNWAIDFMINNTDKVELLNALIQPILISIEDFC